MQLSAVETKMKAYVNWVGRVQKLTDPNGFDIRINPKFELPNGGAYVGGWCRPQTDGPGLRSAALMMFADLLMNNSQGSYAQSTVLPLVKNDLEWVFTNWSSNGCDLWEEVRSSDFFWNRAGYVYSLSMCEQLFNKAGDSSFASRCSSAKSAVQATLSGHWTGSFVTESDNRQKDTAVIHAFSSFDVFSLTDDKVAKTIKTLAMTFCSEYAINQQDTKKGEPGVLMGRYPGDSYAGGNPWQLLTAVLAKTFYQGASSALNQGFEELEDQHSWHDLLKIDRSASRLEFAQAAVKAGDAVMWRLYKYVKNDGGHIAEQISRSSGAQVSAKDLTWSYANILSAMKERGKSLELIEMKKTIKEE
jgi:glucoamylase